MKTHCKNYLILICIVVISLLSTKLNAQHFVLEFPPCCVYWTIYLQGATLNGYDLEEGDEIAIFDGDTITGVFYLHQVCTPENTFENNFIALNCHTIGNNTPGNEAFFKCWDASEEIEASNFSIQLFDPYGDAWTENIFPDGGNEYSIAEINFISGYQQQIELSEAFSFISSHIIPEEMDMLIVLESILNNNLEYVRNSQGQTIQKIGPNWVNGIGNWVIDEGYFVKMFNEDSFSIIGEIVDPATPIQVESGFQFVSYFPETSIDALIAFESIIGENLSYIRNSQGHMLRKIGPNWVNGIGDCNPGEGYLIKMNADDVLIYPGTSALIQTDPHFYPLE
jgi:hypothetical protein